ncbi:MAG: hypothetical protein NTX88_03580 [Candidatus Atribacteria bacterium]|nr:hypothetical protein [Candidatus Atribacteria bacterium]
MNRQRRQAKTLALHLFQLLGILFFLIFSGMVASAQNETLDEGRIRAAQSDINQAERLLTSILRCGLKGDSTVRSLSHQLPEWKHLLNDLGTYRSTIKDVQWDVTQIVISWKDKAFPEKWQKMKEEDRQEFRKRIIILLDTVPKTLDEGDVLLALIDEKSQPSLQDFSNEFAKSQKCFQQQANHISELIQNIQSLLRPFLHVPEALTLLKKSSRLQNELQTRQAGFHNSFDQAQRLIKDGKKIKREISDTRDDIALSLTDTMRKLPRLEQCRDFLASLLVTPSPDSLP